MTMEIVPHNLTNAPEVSVLSLQKEKGEKLRQKPVNEHPLVVRRNNFFPNKCLTLTTNSD